ncbi:uncharacterized protein LOC120902510 [Anopheles arabiensis]|uniref:Chitin-binding type-2 domain-containing protein n=1 Tax=Anopheles arabiensis TaxID=7173 RepID=A0A182HV93_ANOAR|nr:uncharacterized protein LOC120902510 [Anopheles arabiensis]
MNLCQIEIVLVLIAVWVNQASAAQHPAQLEGCPEATRPHPGRCDQYYRCALLPSKTAVWITTQCRKGLIYRHQRSGCVVPDNDWECDLSSDLVRDHSEESIYGIDNPHQQAFPPSRTPPATDNQMRPTDTRRTQYQLPSIAGDDRRGILILMDQELNNRTRIRSTDSLVEEQNGTGEESLERVDEDVDTTDVLTDNGTVVKSYSPPHSFHQGADRDSFANNEQPPPKPLGQGFLDSSHLNSILGDYIIQGGGGGGGGQSHKTRLPLPPNGKIHPEHLTQIINQQKQLNRIATQMKQRVDPTGGVGDFSAFANNRIFSRKPALPYDYLMDASYTMSSPQQHLIDGGNGDKTFKPKGPYMSEDIIKSILQISQQMIANHQKTASTAEMTRPDPEPVPKPIFLPLSVGTTSAVAAPPSPIPEYATPTKPKITTTFNSKPIGISFTNPYTLGHTAVYDNLRNQPLNESMYYSSYQPTLYDIYGNRFVPKDSYVQMMPQNFPQYNPYLATASTASLLNRQPMPTYPSVVSPYVSPPQPQGPMTGDAAFLYSHLTNSPSMLQLQNNMPDSYSVPSNAIDRFEPLDSKASDESSDNDSSDSDPPYVSGESSDESSQIAEVDEPQSDPPSPTYNENPFEQSESALAYTQYKDSIMPLLDANPGDVRISVATCTLGSREPNKTDCFKYFVCNPQNGAFQSFTCPSFTAFNKETRLCDTASYQACKSQQTPTTTTPPSIIRYKGSAAHPNSHLMKNDILTAQKYVELIRQEANKLLTRNNMPLPAEQIVVLPALDTVHAAEFHTVKPSVKVRRKSSSKHSPKPTTTSTTMTTTTTTTTTAAPTVKRSKTARKGPRCRAEGRIPNPLDQHSYYVCHRKSQKKFVKMKMTCPSGLKYCAASQYCSSHC